VTTRTLGAPPDRNGVRTQAGRRSAVLAAGLVVALVVPWVGLQSTAAIVAPTLAPNAGFEIPAPGGVGPAEWMAAPSNGGTGRPLWTAQRAHSGRRAVGVADPSGEYGWHTPVAIQAGVLYRLSAFASAPGAAPARVHIAWFAGDGHYLGSSSSALHAWTDGWVALAVDGRAPPMAVRAELILDTTGGGPGTAVWFDDVFFGVLPATLSWTTRGTEHVFALGQPVTLSLSVRAQATAPRTLPLAVTVTDLQGSVVFSATHSLTLAAAPAADVAGSPDVTARISVTVPVTQTGWYSASAVLGGALPSTVDLAVAVITPTAPSTLPLALDPSPFGVGAYLSTLDPSGAALATTPALLATLGARWDREEFRWQTIEPSPGQFFWQTTDAVVTAAHRAGLSLVGVLDYWSSWTQPYSPGGARDFAAFAAAVVARYRPGGVLAQQHGWTDGYGVRAWEVWNEPATLAYWTSTPQQFGALLKVTSPAIHAADPQATVLYTSFGAVGDPLVLAVAGATAIDAIALHFYAGPVAPEEQRLAAAIAAAHARTGGKPVWVTETGYAVFLGGATAPVQADYLVRSFAEMIAAGAQHILWFAWRDFGTEGAYGLTTGDRQPKPALVAYATMTGALAGMRPTGVLPLGTALRGITFASGQRQVAVVWSIADTPGTLQLAFGSREVTALDVMGRSVGTVSGSSRTLPLTGSPLFLSAVGLSHSAFAALVTSGTVAGIAPVGVRVEAPEAPQSSLPRVVVDVSGRTTVVTHGRVAVLVPPSWGRPPAPQPYGPLPPGATQVLTFTPAALSSLPDPRAVVTAVVLPALSPAVLTATTTVSTAAPIAETVALRGTPHVDGSLSGWAAAPPVLLDRREQLIGFPGWSPATFSAAARLLWDQSYVYLSAVVTDTDFYQPRTGFSLYEGDSLQWSFQFGTRAPYSFGLALTSQGTQLYRYEGGGTLAPGLLTDAPAAVTLRPGSPTVRIIYTVGLPWHAVGLAGPPPPGSRFLGNVLVNDNRQGVRAGWLTLTASRGTGFSPASFLSWEMRAGPALAAVRLPAAPATLTSTAALTFTAPSPALELLIAPGVTAGRLALTLNGRSVWPVAGSLPALSAGLPRVLDVSSTAQVGTNVLTMAGCGTTDATVTVVPRPPD